MFNPKDLYKKFYARDEPFTGFPSKQLEQYYAACLRPENNYQVSKLSVPADSDEGKILDSKKHEPIVIRFSEEHLEYERPW